MVKVYIMRGIPGAGKSTFVRKNWPSATVISADNYPGLYGADGNINRDELPKAHNWATRMFNDALQTAYGNIVVDNTNIRMFEIAPYYRLAEAYCWDVEIVWLHVNPVLAIERGIHKVPPQTVMSMATSFEPLPPWWKVRHVFN